MACTVSQLPLPARYFPLARGRYEVRPGLARLGTDFGNGSQDAQVFQLDRQFPEYRRQKLAARAEDLTKYHPPGTSLTSGSEAVVHEVIATRLAEEYPACFVLAPTPEGRVLCCRLTGERLRFGADWEWLGVEAARTPVPTYRSGLDALACQVQEDLALVEVDATGRDRLAAVHLCFPNHWAAQDKIGRDFVAVHAPVADIEPISRNAGKLIRALIEKGPFVRFAWGVASDTRLNHHPEAPPGEDPQRWRGRDFDPQDPRLYLRIERQTTLGLPGADGYLFTIRTYFLNGNEIGAHPQRNRALRDALASMSAASLAYKGLTTSRDAIVDWLDRWRD